MLNLERLGNFTAELSANLVKSIVLPGGLLTRLTRPSIATGKPEQKSEADVPVRGAVPLGPLVLVGGYPVPDDVIVQIMHLCGGRGARVAILPTGADDPDQAIETALRLFTRFGMRSVEAPDITTRDRADSLYWAEKLAQFDAVVLYGNRVHEALEVLSGTLCAGVLHQLSASGRPVIGCAAGAVILGERCMLEDGSMAAGLGLAPRLAVETGFGLRSPFGRLLQVVGAQAPAQFLGVGLDEGTALFMRDGEARVLGERSVTLVDGRDTTPLEEGSGASCGTAPICGVKVHVLVTGFSVNLKTWRPAAPVREPAQVAGA